jgi:integrase-like protein
VTALEAGTSIDATKETVAAFLERWIEHMQGQVAPRSLERYAEIAHKNLAPLLGGLQLANTACCGRRYSKQSCGRPSRAIRPIS